MAKQYYSAEEARQKLHTDDDGLKLLVRQGRLREFRDAGKLNYRVEEVDAIVAEKAGALGGSGELLQMAFGGQGYVLVQPSESVMSGGHQGGGQQGPGGMLG